VKKTLLALGLSAAAWCDPTWTATTPKFPLIAPASSWVELEVKGPAGAQPQLQGPGQGGLRGGGSPLTEMRPGIYRGRFQPIDGDLRIDGEVLGSSQAVAGLLGVFEVTRNGAVFRTGPSSDYDRLTPVTAGVRFEALQRQGDWLQVRCPLGWIKLSDGNLLDASASLGNPQLTQIRVHEPANRIQLRLGSPCAWQVREDVEGHKLWVDLPGVPMAMFHIAYAQKSKNLPSLRVLPLDNGTRVEIPLRQRVWGYQTSWNGQDLILQVTPAPRVDPKHPLRGLRITLDAGHGGKDSGTVGLGLHVQEKDLNFRVTSALKAELEKGGARVTMTRSGDRQVSAESAPADQELQSRVEVAERNRAQLFLSIHHNARPDVKDGRVSHGTHVYYYQACGRGLAQAIAEPLAKAIGEPEWMHLWRSFHVIRQTGMPAVLVEVNFLSNPELEKGMLAAPDYAKKAARGMRIGIENFLRRDL
jgi:N-acetylmuramoyl-L-alanine amidase